MGRRGMTFCMLCDYEGNGSKGESPAIGKYCIPRGFVCDDGEKAQETGWFPVCEDCMKVVAKHNPQFERVYFDERPVDDTKYGEHYHRFGPKSNLVSNSDGTDTYKCLKCGEKFNRNIIHQSLLIRGCKIPNREASP